MRAEIETIDFDRLVKATEAVEKAIAARFGKEPVSLPMQAPVVEARR